MEIGVRAETRAQTETIAARPPSQTLLVVLDDEKRLMRRTRRDRFGLRPRLGSNAHLHSPPPA